TLAVVATVLAVSDNGLAFTAVAEFAGARWSGRALGTQNTAQFVAISAATPLMAAAIEQVGYWPVFVAAAGIAAVAIPLVPADQRRCARRAPGAGVPATGGPHVRDHQQGPLPVGH